MSVHRRSFHMPSIRSPFFRMQIACLLLLAGCSQATGLPTAPATAPDSTLIVFPTATWPATAPALEVLTTATVLPVGGAEPVGAEPASQAEYVLIRNTAGGTTLYEAEQQARLGQPDREDPAAQWKIEDYQGSKRIRNRASGNYLAIENQRGYVEVIPVEAVWMSPRWTFDSDPAAGSTLIRNVWHNWEVLYAEPSSEQLRYGRPPADPKVSQWAIEPLGGGLLAAGTATPVVALPTPAAPAGSRGAAVPWIEYEAEAGETNGEILGPDRTFGTIAAEASGRQAVQLDAAGEYVQLTAQEAANSIVMRYVIPDSPAGDGITATLSLYVDGSFVQKLVLTSRYAWSYGGEAATYNQPEIGGAHHFFDETRSLVKDIPKGAQVRLQVDAEDTADYYTIDLFDLEQVDPPKTMPAGFLSVTADCGAIPDDGREDGHAIQECIDQARSLDTGVWLPAGTFESLSGPFEVDEVTIQGAGMWYTTLHGLYARFNCTGNNCRYADFSILGETITRDDQSPENGFNGGAGLGSRLENIWVEHTKVGYWVGPGATNGLVILNSRFRNLFADGVNFCNGTRNSVVENSHFRNTGDDALASWSPAQSGGVNTNNVFRFNTVQIPWRANCFAIYGGQDNKIEDNICSDVVTYPGILIAQSFSSHPFSGTTIVSRNSLIRAGGPMFRQEHGALKIRTEQGDIAQVVVNDLLIDSPTFAGVEIEGSYAVSAIAFENVEILNPGTWGILIRSNVAGEVDFEGVTVVNPGQEGLLNYAPKLHFTLQKGAGNSGW